MPPDIDLSKFDDDALLRLILRRQEIALSALYDRYSRLVYSIGLNVLGDPAAAEEVTQDTFLRVWERAETYRSEQSKVATWLARIARNRAIDLIRQRNVRPEANSISWDELPTGDSIPNQEHVEDEVELNQSGQRLRSAIAQLPLEQRQILELAYFQGLTQQEIVSRLGLPLGTVKTRVRLAMQKLRLALSE